MAHIIKIEEEINLLIGVIKMKKYLSLMIIIVVSIFAYGFGRGYYGRGYGMGWNREALSEQQIEEINQKYSKEIKELEVLKIELEELRILAKKELIKDKPDKKVLDNLYVKRDQLAIKFNKKLEKFHKSMNEAYGVSPYCDNDNYGGSNMIGGRRGYRGWHMMGRRRGFGGWNMRRGGRGRTDYHEEMMGF